MIKIFISHSKKDVNLVNRIQTNLRNVGIEPVIEEFTSETRPPYVKIYNDMLTSQASFLLLTPNVKITDYTQNWISYEVGLAHCMNKRVFVFEQYNQEIHFPIPYLTDYIIYDPTFASDWQKIQKIAKSLEQTPMLANIIIMGLLGAIVAGEKKRLEGAIIGGLAGVALTPKQDAGIVNKVQCPKCGITFDFYSNLKNFSCPSCRIKLQLI